jgi:hypothetical protein
MMVPLGARHIRHGLEPDTYVTDWSPYGPQSPARFFAFDSMSELDLNRIELIEDDQVKVPSDGSEGLLFFLDM